MDDPQKLPARDHDYARLPPHMKRLVNILERIASDCPLPPARNRADLQLWDHEDYLYLEFDVPGVVGSELDICIHGGRAFIRIER